MIVSLRDAKISTRELLEMINSYSKVAGYKINLKKSVAFLYANNKQLEKEFKDTIPLTKASKTIKYLGTNLSKDIKDLYNKSFKPLKKLKKTSEDGKKPHILMD